MTLSDLSKRDFPTKRNAKQRCANIYKGLHSHIIVSGTMRFFLLRTVVVRMIFSRHGLCQPVAWAVVSLMMGFRVLDFPTVAL